MVSDAVVRDLGAVVIDVDNLTAMAAFWRALLGEEPGLPRSGGNWLTVGALKKRFMVGSSKSVRT